MSALASSFYCSALICESAACHVSMVAGSEVSLRADFFGNRIHSGLIE